MLSMKTYLSLFYCMIVSCSFALLCRTVLTSSWMETSSWWPARLLLLVPLLWRNLSDRLRPSLSSSRSVDISLLWLRQVTMKETSAMWLGSLILSWSDSSSSSSSPCVSVRSHVQFRLLRLAQRHRRQNHFAWTLDKHEWNSGIQSSVISFLITLYDEITQFIYRYEQLERTKPMSLVSLRGSKHFQLILCSKCRVY